MPPKKKKVQYFTVQFEKYLEIVTDVDRAYYILCDRIKENVVKLDPEKWIDTEVPYVLDTFLMTSSYRQFLDDKINNPTDEEIEFTTKNNIKDVLFMKEELMVLQQLWLEFEARKQFLLENYSFSLTPS